VSFYGLVNTVLFWQVNGFLSFQDIGLSGTYEEKKNRYEDHDTLKAFDVSICLFSVSIKGLPVGRHSTTTLK